MNIKPHRLTVLENYCPLRDLKVSIFGAGRVGTACGFILLLRRITNHIVFIDKNEGKLSSEIIDMQPYDPFYNNAIVEGTTKDFSKIENSRVCLITVGGRILPGETKMDTLQRNVEILRSIIPHIVKHCPDSIIIVVSHPVDIMAYFAWKMSKFPANRVFGAGHLYSKSFQYEVAEHLGVSSNILNAWIVGEYGDSGVSLFSSVNIAGTRIKEINPSFGTATDDDRSFEVHKRLLNLPHKTTILKGYTAWGASFCVAAIVNSILRNKNELYSVSILAKGIENIERNIFLSLPCSIGCNGARNCIIPQFSEEEAKKFEKSAEAVDKKLKKCNFWTVTSPS